MNVLEELYRTEFVRKANEDDFAAVTEIIMAEQQLLKDMKNSDINEATILQAIQDEDLFVEIDNEHIVAVGWLQYGTKAEYQNWNWGYQPSERTIVWMKYFGVAPQYQRKGYGESLLKFFVDYTVMQGNFYMRMAVRKDNKPCLMLLEKMNYQLIGPGENASPADNMVCYEKKMTKH